MANYLWTYDLQGGIANRQFTNTYQTSVQQNATYDPTLIPPDSSVPPRPPRVPPAEPPVDSGFKILPLFDGTEPTSGPKQQYAWMIPTPRSADIFPYPAPGEEGNVPAVYPQKTATLDYDGGIMVCKLWHIYPQKTATLDYDGGIMVCKLWHIYEGGPIRPNQAYGDEQQYPPHDFWNEFRSVPAHTISLRAKIDYLMSLYPRTEFITIQPRAALAIGHAIYGCGDPDDGYFSHVETMPDSPQGAVSNWDWYSWTDYQPFSLSGSYPRGEDQDDDRVEIARSALNGTAPISYKEDKWFVEPISTIQRGYEPDFNSTTGNHYLLRPTALSWANQNPDNKANRIFWLPEEVDSATWSATGAWGHVTVNTLGYYIKGWIVSPDSSAWMAVL